MFGDTGGDASGSIVVDEDADQVQGALNGKGWAQLTRREKPVWINADRVWYFQERP